MDSNESIDIGGDVQIAAIVEHGPPGLIFFWPNSGRLLYLFLLQTKIKWWRWQWFWSAMVSDGGRLDGGKGISGI